MTCYDLVAIKRRWVPEWLFWLACGRVPIITWRQAIIVQPLRWLLTEKAA